MQESPLLNYLNAIKDIKESDNEHTYRTPLENLLKALAEKHKNVKIIHEQSSAEFKASSIGASAEFKGKQKSLGRPDFTVLEGSLTLGYIENKRVNENLQALIDEANKDENAQIARYLKLQDNLILTDYLNFWRVKKDEKGKILAPQKLALCTLNENTDSKLHTLKTLTNPKSLKHQDSQEALNAKEVELLNFFNLFFSSTPKPISTAKDFAAALVVPTKFIRDELIELKDNERIKDLYETFHKGLYDELSFDDFADNFAQTLVYSLFLAKFHKDTAINSASSHTQNYTSHINSNTNATQNNSNASNSASNATNSSSNHTQGYTNTTNSNTNSTQGYSNSSSSHANSASSYNTPITLNNVTDFIPNSFELLNSFSDTLKVLNRFEGLRWILDHILALMNHISTADLLLEFSKHSKDLDLFDEKIHANPAIHFYENFISHYNKILRKDKGIYYTPEPIVSFIIKAVNLCLKQDLGFEKGLQTATKNDEIKLLDFATGTGAFLLEAFYQAFESNKALKDKPASYYDDLRRLISNFRAFELLIAPYAIAHLNLSIALKNSFDYILKDDERLNIFLTNTLEDEVSEVATLFGSKQESKGVKETKQNFKILIITGNPPYNATSQNKFDYTYKPKDKDERRLSKIQAHYYYCGTKPKEQNPKEIIPIYLDEKNPKWLQDDYVKFIRFAESKIERQEKGIIAIITNNAFLDNPTFRGMRWHLLNNFDKIYILDLHGNTRKKELCPDGSKDDNVFDIMQGVCISVFVKTGKRSPCKCEFTRQAPALAEGVWGWVKFTLA